jgi:2-polyprenyl-3-methyl-5-hydroxy-6-metoxy-1,4-benzoquinol methylase
MDSTADDKSKDLWAAEADDEQRYGKGFHWVESPVVSEYMNLSISGNPALNWLQYSVVKYIEARPSPRILSLGCGGGALERDLLRLKPDALLVAMDFSAGAISVATARAALAGLRIDYRVADLNEIELEPHAFDFVFASSALHHIKKLEHILDQIRAALRPSGMLIGNEYIGPNQLQWTPAQVEAINEILALLPDRYRRRVSDATAYKRHFPGPSPVEYMNEQDPTEAIRSEEIAPLIRQKFQVIEYTPFGGTILHMLLQDIVGNFNPSNEVDSCILKLICHVERKLISARILPSDFAYFVAKVENAAG